MSDDTAAALAAARDRWSCAVEAWLAARCDANTWGEAKAAKVAEAEAACRAAKDAEYQAWLAHNGMRRIPVAQSAGQALETRYPFGYRSEDNEP
jgi:hypothetical protein